MMVMSPRGRNAPASTRMPSECTPSSLVTRIRGIGIHDHSRLRSLAGSMRGDERTIEGKNHRGGYGKRRAGVERSRRPDGLPEKTEQQARGEGTKAEHGVVPPECGALCVVAREIGDERLFASLDQREVNAVDQKPRQEREETMTCCEAGIHHCVQNPPADDQFTTTMSIRQRAAIGRQASLDDMQSRPRERQELSGKACVRQSQQQERVARVAERKHGQNDQKALQLARQRRNGSYCGRLRRSLAASNSGLGNEQQHHECNDAGHDREPEQRPISAWCQPEETCREQWTDYGACVVHRAMESKHMSAFSLGREGAEHRITRRASQSFADAIAD